MTIPTIRTLLLLICTLSTPASTLHGQAIDSLVSKFEQSKLNPAEKVFVHLNKFRFVPGEAIWFKVYLVNDYDLTPGALSNLAYVELINPAGKVIEKRNIQITNGAGNGDILLPDSLSAGTYLLRSYTRFMLNEGRARGVCSGPADCRSVSFSSW